MGQALTFKEKAGYASGDLAGNFIWQMLMFFLPGFYTDVFGLPLGAIATMFFLVRILDAVNDPVMGMIADRTRTRWGNFRPYLLWFAVPYAIVGAMVFHTPEISESGKIIYAYITYITLMIIFTAITIPFNALSGVMTSNHMDRTSLNSYRFAFAYAGGLIVQGLTLPLVRQLGGENEQIGYFYTMLVYGVAAMLLFFLSFSVTRERIRPRKEIQSRLSEDLLDLMKNRSWLVLFLFSFVFLTCIALRSGIIVYYFKYFLKLPEATSLFLVSGTAITLACTFLSKPMARIFGKARSLVACLILMGLSLAGFYFVESGQMFRLYLFQVVFAMASGPVMPLVWSMLADTADYNEWKNGRRATGLTFSAATLSQKFGVALGGSLLMILLGAFGYEANTEQTLLSNTGIKLIMSLIPAGIALITAGIMVFYKLNTEMMNRVQQDLEMKQNMENDE